MLKVKNDGWMSIEREHFDKIKIRSFRNLGIRALMLTKSWWERPINSWRTRYFSFFLTSKDAWQRFCLIETWKFLGFTQDLVFSFSSRQCGSPQHTPRPPALVLEGFSSGERLEPGPGPSDASAARPPHVPKHVRPYHVGQRVCDDDDAPGRVPDHVLGHTVLLASPTGPLPSTE